MTLVRIARFHSLSEAQVVASVLRSAGIPALISDAYYLGVFPTDTIALGGFRLLVVHEDAADAVEIIRLPPPPDTMDEPAVRHLPTWQRLMIGGVLVAALFGVVAFESAWIAAIRENRSRLLEKSVAAVVTVALTLGSLVLLVLAALYLHELLIDPP